MIQSPEALAPERIKRHSRITRGNVLASILLVLVAGGSVKVAHDHLTTHPVCGFEPPGEDYVTAVSDLQTSVEYALAGATSLETAVSRKAIEGALTKAHVDPTYGAEFCTRIKRGVLGTIEDQITGLSFTAQPLPGETTV